MLAFTRIFKATLGLSILCLASISCKQFVDIPNPTTRLTSSSVYSDDATADAAVRGIYSSMMQSGINFSDGYQSVGLLCGMSSDELSNYSLTPEYVQFASNNINPNNSFIYSMWAEFYNYIYDANAIIEGLSTSVNVSPKTKNQLTGEAKFIRSFCLFYLVNLYGDVPLDTTTNYKTNLGLARASKDSIYKEIISDLTSAETLLGDDYSYSNGERTRPNKWTAMSLLARTYLYSKDWINAENAATSVINSPLFSLVDVNSVFLANDSEAIWQLQPVIPGYNTIDGDFFNLSVSYGPNTYYNVCSLTPELSQSFEANDSRFSAWVGIYNDGTTNYYYPTKYKVVAQAPGAAVTEYLMVFRLAEQYLIRAEARSEQGKINGLTGALSDIDTIRNRARLPDYAGATDKTSLLMAILHERQVEFFTEWGHRWLDLKRSGFAATVLDSVKPNWQGHDTLYPIPQSDRIKDPNLTQNTGY